MENKDNDLNNIIQEAFNKFVLFSFPKPWKKGTLEKITDILRLWPRCYMIMTDNKIFNENQTKYIIALLELGSRVESDEIKYRKETEPELDNNIMEFITENKKNFVKNKIEHLMSNINDLTLVIKDRQAFIKELSGRTDDTSLFMHIAGDEIESATDKLKECKAKIQVAKGDIAEKRFNKETIRLAKKVSFEKLLEINKFTKMGKCPFHNEKTRSFHITPENRGHCFGCGKTVDNITYLMEIKRYSFREAVNYLLSL